MQTLYTDISEQLAEKFAKIKLLVCDIDGVFSDGKIYMGNDGEELKTFNTKDGFGVKALIASGVPVAVITGRTSNIVQTRMTSLNITDIVQGTEDKLPALTSILEKYQVAPEQVAYIGDDMPDLVCIEHVGLGVAVGDAHPLVKAGADYITSINGGSGCVREVCDTIMQLQGTLAAARGASV
ncbi:3-deoxy-manno-octulosonate-8-phosphatase KdsC [Thalassotalea agarivorans]|uniref:3-deoxy-D-manno-octulosonate 8-phosphate phosphatase KdsC n=1 Tax=Thalassotalea agarivorans TaxID=349064 RepID=A0A1I0FUP0_THASX|nr:3-deoxy-manno-octulosonate-8-phosphatase KdsC [Thalassotalea agarivorans]SET61292.1 3-deoxy-D-manno-octulosonate 8-phosphate phosphatase (KDO 8-P phosphatase) [Thalassotalea agarivorans]